MNEYSVIEKQNEIMTVALAVAKIFDLRLNKIEFVVGDEFYGKCSIDGVIKIKLVYSDGEKIPLMEVWRTVAHELAHLKHFNHGDDFWRFNKEVLAEVSKLVGRRIRPEIAFLSKFEVIH